MEKAALNELTLFKNIRPRAGGSYVNPLTGVAEQAPCDILQLSSNRNNEGNIMSLDRLLAHEGQLNYALQYTAGGNSLQERLPDIEGWEYNEYGDPECGFTQAITIFSRKSERIISYLGYKTSAILAQSCLAEPDPESTLEQRTALVRAMKIVETEDENLISKSVL